MAFREIGRRYFLYSILHLSKIVSSGFFRNCAQLTELKNGATSRDRTADPSFTKAVLYQLS